MFDFICCNGYGSSESGKNKLYLGDIKKKINIFYAEYDYYMGVQVNGNHIYTYI